MHLPLPLTEQMLLEVEQVGFSREELTNLKIDAQQVYRFDPETRQLIVHQNDLQFRGLAGFKSKFHLSNIELSFFQLQDPQKMNPFTLIADLGNIQMISMELFLEVGALTNRVYEGLSKKNSIPVSDLKKQVAALAGSVLQENPKITDEVAKKILDFLKTPGDVRVTLDPEKPVSVLEVLALSKNIDLLMETLNVGIETF
jgi:hypothetical protein